ncbi:membrane dipeptidase [Thalassobaculum sp.]|uniref:membrane dipeptidase n=1 Tax=Thalassobaculum sp. TaxID=2022740 RepID=UPI0032EC6A60
MAPVDADEIRDRARRLIRDSFVVDGNLSPANWREDLSCDPASPDSEKRDLGCWPRSSVGSFIEIRDQMGVDLLSSSGKTASDPSRAVWQVLTSNDIDEARWARHVGVIRYIQKPGAVSTARVVNPTENLTLLAERRVKAWSDDGIRVVQLAYSKSENDKLISAIFDSRYGGGANQDAGVRASGAGDCGSAGNPPCVPLTALGLRLVTALLDRFMLIDLSHVGRETALRVATLAKARNRPVMANHANASAVFTDSISRNQDDAVICAIAATGGVVGVTPIRFMLSGSALNTVNKWDNRELLVAHVNHIRDLECRDDAGRRIRMVEHISVASDSYVNGSPDRLTWLNVRGFNDRDRWMDLAELMIRRHGYSDSDIRRIFGANLMRVYRAGLPGLTRPVVTTAAGVDEPVLPRSPRIAWTPAVAQAVLPPSSHVMYLYSRTAAGGRSFMVVLPTVGGADFQLPRLRANARYSVFVRATNGIQRVNSTWFDFRTGG